MGTFDDDIRDVILRRNQQFAKPGPYATYLSAPEEQQFRDWVTLNNVPYDFRNEGVQDYDMRGFYMGLMSGDPRALTGVNPNDHRLHFSDTWKTPYHQSFSNESMYATPNAPHWEGNKLVGDDGTVYYDEEQR